MGMDFRSILIVGCGNMAGAMLRGWLAAGLDPSRFAVFDPFARELPEGVRRLDALPRGVRIEHGNRAEQRSRIWVRRM